MPEVGVGWGGGSEVGTRRLPPPIAMDAGRTQRVGRARWGTSFLILPLRMSLPKLQSQQQRLHFLN